MIFLYIGGGVPGSNWQAVGNITNFGTPRPRIYGTGRLSATTFAVLYGNDTDQSTTALQAFGWDGSDFTSISSALSVPGDATMDALSNDTVVVAFDDGTVKQFELSGGAWSEISAFDVGEDFDRPTVSAIATNQFVLHGASGAGARIQKFQYTDNFITRIGAETVLPDSESNFDAHVAGQGEDFIAVKLEDGAGNNVIRRYQFDGLQYSQIGNDFDLDSYGRPISGFDALKHIDTLGVMPTIDNFRRAPRLEYGGSDYTQVGDNIINGQQTGGLGGMVLPLTANRAVHIYRPFQFPTPANQLRFQMYELIVPIAPNGQPMPISARPNVGGFFEITGMEPDPGNPVGTTGTVNLGGFVKSGSFYSGIITGGTDDNAMRKFTITGSDLSSPSFQAQRNVSFVNHQVNDVWVNSTESRMFISYNRIASNQSKIRQYDFGTNGDVTTTSLVATVDIQALIGGTFSRVRSLYIDSLEEDVILNGGDNKIYKLRMATPGDLTTLFYTGDFFDLTGTGINSYSVWLNGTKSKLFTTDAAAGFVWELEAGTNGVLSSLQTPAIKQYLPSGAAPTERFIGFNSSGSRMYIIDRGTSALVPGDLYQFDAGP